MVVSPNPASVCAPHGRAWLTAGESPDPQTLLVATRVEFAGDILWAVSALFAIAVILRITGAQRRALRRAT